MDKRTLDFPDELLVVGAAVETGIFARLERGSATGEDLVRELGLDRRALDAVLDYLAAAGYIAAHEDAWHLSESARKVFYEEDSPSFEGFGFMHGYLRLKTWLSLPEVIRTGIPPEKTRGRRKSRYFVESLRRYAREVAPDVVKILLGTRHAPRVLDLGGGPLNYAVPFARAGARVTVVDTPEIIELVEDDIPAGMPVSLWPGDFLRELPSGPFDIAFLGNITHIYSAEENAQVFRLVGQVLAPGGLVAVLDMVRDGGPVAAYMAVNMLLSTRGGGTYSLQQYGEWMAAAGCGRPEVHQVSGRHLLLARKRVSTTY